MVFATLGSYWEIWPWHTFSKFLILDCLRKFCPMGPKFFVTKRKPRWFLKSLYEKPQFSVRIVWGGGSDSLKGIVGRCSFGGPSCPGDCVWGSCFYYSFCLFGFLASEKIFKESLRKCLVDCQLWFKDPALHGDPQSSRLVLVWWE